MLFSFTISTDLVLYGQIVDPATKSYKDFITFLMISTMLTGITAAPLIITTQKETTINEIADEIIRLRSNEIKNIFEIPWSLWIFTVLIYVICLFVAIKLLEPNF